MTVSVEKIRWIENREPTQTQIHGFKKHPWAVVHYQQSVPFQLPCEIDDLAEMLGQLFEFICPSRTPLPHEGHNHRWRKDSRQILANYLTNIVGCNRVRIWWIGSTGLEAIKQHNPDIVFWYWNALWQWIWFIGKSGWPFFWNRFVTAFGNYAIQALNQSAAYYLLKPIDIDEWSKAVERSKNRTQRIIIHATRPRAARQHEGNSQQKIMLPTLEGFEIMSINKILYCEAADNLPNFSMKASRSRFVARWNILKMYCNHMGFAHPSFVHD